MTKEEAIRILECGGWWDLLDPAGSDADLDLLHEALDVALAALRAQQADGWISVKDRLPEELEEALTAKEMAEVACALDLLKEYQFVGSVEHFRELSQAEHDGRLVVLPCKRGQTVYFYADGSLRKGGVYNIEVFSDGFVFHTENNGYYACFSDSDIGESVFFAREEAEAATPKANLDWCDHIKRRFEKVE